MPENFKDYELSVAKEAPPWGVRENTLFKDMITLLPNKGVTLLNAEHKHDNLWSSDGAIEALNVDAAGRVGIGTNSPLTLLHIQTASTGGIVDASGDEILVENTADVGITMLAGVGSVASLFFGDSGGSAQGRVIYRNSSDQLEFSTLALTALTINSSQQVGVGVTPTNLFQVAIPSADSGSTKAHFGTGTYGIELGNRAGGGFEPFVCFLPEEANDASGLIFEIEPADDSGAVPIGIFDARQNDDTDITTRPLFSWRNNGSVKMSMDKDGILALGSSASTTPKLHLSDGTNVAVIELDANNDLIISSDSGPQPGGMIWDTSANTCTLTANDGVAVQNLYPLLINWSSNNGAPTNNDSAIGLNNDVGANGNVGIAFLTGGVQRFTLQAEIVGAALDMVLYKGTTEAAADIVFKYDDDGTGSSEGQFVFGAIAARNVVRLVLTSNGDDDDDALNFSFLSNNHLQTSLGEIDFRNNSDTGVPRNYARMHAQSSSAANGLEEGGLFFSTIIAGSLDNIHQMDLDGFKCFNGATIHALSQNGDPTSTTDGALWLDADAGANGTLKCFSNAAWRTVKAL